MLLRIAAIAGLAVLMLPVAALAKPVVVAGQQVKLEKMTTAETRALFTGVNTVIGSVAVELVVPRDGSPLLKQFLATYLKMSPNKFFRIWMRRVLSGYGVPPRQMNSIEAVNFLASHPKAVAIVDHKDIPPGTRIVRVVDDRR